MRITLSRPSAVRRSGARTARASRRSSWYFLQMIAALLFASAQGCRTHPCGDQSAEMPSVYKDAPVITEGGRVCYARGNEATVMYWGGRERMNEILALVLGRMDVAGWAQHQSKNPFTAPRDPEKPLHIFRKGDEEISIRVHPGQTPRFGAKWNTDSLTFYIDHRTLTDAETRR